MTKRRVREAVPIQVYLVADERQRLDRLAGHLDVSKSDVIRRGLLALERELLSPSEHPALRLIGIAESEARGSVDAARGHDEVLTDAEEAAWASTRLDSRGAKRKRRGR